MQPTPEELKAQLDQAQVALNAKRGIQPTVSADEIANPPAKVTPPVPQVNTNDGSRTTGLVGNVSNGLEGVIGSELEARKKADEIIGIFGAQEQNGSVIREGFENKYNVPDNLARYQDIQTQLARRNTESGITKTRIAGAAGQTMNQAQREITQEDREASIRDSGLAAEASVLQGNIETASTLINNAMSDYYQDRQLDNQNKIQQLEYYSGIADEQTKQLLAKEQRKYEEDQRQIIRAETAVDAAATSGYATAEDIKKLTSLSGDPASQAAYAQGVVANAARQAAAIERSKLAMAQEGLGLERSRLALSQGEADLKRRAQIYELASVGDPQAIEELGFDPTAPKKEAELRQIDVQINEATKAEQKITDLLSNKIGLQSSSGEWQFGEAFTKGFNEGANPVLGPVGVLTGIGGGVKAKQMKSTFLANADYLLTKEGLLEIGDLAAQDIKLTPITEKELAILFQSASLLNAAARRDNGKLKGFSIPDTEVEKEFQNMLLSYTNVKAELAAQKNLGSGAFGELEAIRQQSQQ